MTWNMPKKLGHLRKSQINLTDLENWKKKQRETRKLESHCKYYIYVFNKTESEYVDQGSNDTWNI